MTRRASADRTETIHPADGNNRLRKTVREERMTAYYSYDNASRLTSERWYNAARQSIYAFTWSYDAAGNRHYQNRLGQESYFVYDAGNPLSKQYHKTADQTTYYGYDRSRNCTRIFAPDGVTYFAYDSRNLQTRITHRFGHRDKCIGN